MTNKRMRILHITETHSKEAGGLTTVVNQISKHLVSKSNLVTVIACSSNPDLPAPGVGLVSVPINGVGKPWLWSRTLAKVIEDELDAGRSTIVHLHGVWMAPQWYGARMALHKGIPTILSIHGMLDPWLWKYRGSLVYLKKMIYLKAMAFPQFRRVTAIHAITRLERDCISALFPNQRIEVIPNSIDLSNGVSYFKEPSVTPEPVILFLGRVHPIKGIELLINAFVEARLSKKWRLVIAGPVEDYGYLEKINKLINQLDLEDRVDLIGPVFGDDKWEWLRRVWVLVSPSYSEVVGMVNLEAAACNTPSITTYETGLEDWKESGGLLIHPNVTELTRALEESCSWSESERIDRGKTAYRFVRQRYSLDAVGKQWIDFYQELSR